MKTATQPSSICKTCDSRKNGIFCELSDMHLDAIESSKTVNNYKPRQTLFYEGNQPYGLYCVSRGKVKIYKMDADGHQKIVRLAGPGDTLGYRCMLAGEPYSATAETLEDSTICFIDKTTFFHTLQTHPQTASHVLKTLARDLGQAEKQELNLVHKSIRERLAELFLVFKSRYGVIVEQGVKLDISLSRQDFADLIGTTQESVIRLISEFKNDKLIAVEKKEIILLDIPNLTEAANIVD
jgi:CRP-like cAMP-binding protein